MTYIFRWYVLNLYRITFQVKHVTNSTFTVLRQNFHNLRTVILTGVACENLEFPVSLITQLRIQGNVRGKLELDKILWVSHYYIRAVLSAFSLLLNFLEIITVICRIISETYKRSTYPYHRHYQSASYLPVWMSYLWGTLGPTIHIGY